MLYFTSRNSSFPEGDKNMPFVYLNISEDYERMTEKHFAAFIYMYKNHYNDFDWFIKADEDTYVIVENLRWFLADKCPNERFIYGKVLKQLYYRDWYNAGNLDRGFLQGGSGFVINRETIKLFSETYMKNRSFCTMIKGRYGDQEISNCFRKLGIYPGESRDKMGRERFHMDRMDSLWLEPSDFIKAFSKNPTKNVN